VELQRPYPPGDQPVRREPQPEQHEQLAIGDVQTEIADRLDIPRKDLVDRFEDDLGHRKTPRDPRLAAEPRPPKLGQYTA
jgi:hypothetical protein